MHTKDDFIGAVKIKDGLFMGDEYAAGVIQPHITILLILLVLGL